MKKTIILISTAILFFSLVSFAEGASLFLLPESESFEVGDTFSVELSVNTAGIPINSARTVIYFPSDKLEVLSISKEDSIFALWPEEPTFSNSTGEISFSGGLPHPGFNGTGNIIIINFRAKQEGTAVLGLDQGQVLANDGKGTNILAFVKEADYSIEKAALIEIPQIAIYPETYISGEETFYIEGTSLPEVEIIVSLEKDGKKIKTWQTTSNNQGKWSLLINELVKSGTYYLSAQAKNKKGVASNPSESYKIEILFSGLSLGPIMISFRNLVLFLTLILILGVIIAIYFVRRGRKAKKVLQKETQEAKESLHRGLGILREEIETRIELMDSRPGFNPKEKETCQELKETLRATEESVSKEIQDIEKELK